MNTENDIKMKELAEHFQQEQPHLMRYACYRLGDTDDAKDALQDAFLKISSKFSDEKSVEVRDWRNYIFRVLSNLCSSRLTALGKLRTIPLDARLDIAISQRKTTNRTTNESPSYLWKSQRNRLRSYVFESMETTALLM